jgi:hypothetical protein
VDAEDLTAVDERLYCPMCGMVAAAFIAPRGGRITRCGLCKQEFRVELWRAHDR